MQIHNVIIYRMVRLTNPSEYLKILKIKNKTLQTKVVTREKKDTN